MPSQRQKSSRAVLRASAEVTAGGEDGGMAEGGLHQVKGCPAIEGAPYPSARKPPDRCRHSPQSGARCEAPPAVLGVHPVYGTGCDLAAIAIDLSFPTRGVFSVACGWRTRWKTVFLWSYFLLDHSSGSPRHRRIRPTADLTVVTRAGTLGILDQMAAVRTSGWRDARTTEPSWLRAHPGMRDFEP